MCLVITEIPVPEGLFSKGEKSVFLKIINSCQCFKFQSNTISLAFSHSESPHLKHEGIHSFAHFLQPLASCLCHYLTVLNVLGTWIVFCFGKDNHQTSDSGLLALSSLCPHGPCLPAHVCMSLAGLGSVSFHSKEREQGGPVHLLDSGFLLVQLALSILPVIEPRDRDYHSLFTAKDTETQRIRPEPPAGFISAFPNPRHVVGA